MSSSHRNKLNTEKPFEAVIIAIYLMAGFIIM